MSTETFEPVRCLSDLDALNQDDIATGYCEWSKDDPWPGLNRGRAYWHGWRNAAIDHRAIDSDDASRQLAHEYLARERTRRAA